MMNSGPTARFGRVILLVAASSLAVAACSKKQEADTSTTTTTETTAATNAAADPTATPAPTAAAAPTADSTDTLDGSKFASFTGDAAKGATDFIACKTCHAIELGVNKIGPSLHAVVGRKAGEIAGYSYSAANKGSGITWTEAKLFQYLESPSRVVPGTKMSYAGLKDPQKRADVIAYLKSNG